MVNLGKVKIILIIGIFLFFNPSNPQPVQAWGLVVHQFIAEEAVNVLDPSWQEVFDALIVKLKSGSIYPDSLHPTDTPNHLYYPDDPSYGTAPEAIDRYYNYFVGNLTEKNYQEAVFSAGIFSHYMADINIPVHTDQYWLGHSAFEKDVNKYLSEMTIGTVTIDSDIPDIKQYIKDAAINAKQYYNDVRSVYVTGDEVDQVNSNTTLKTMVEGQLTRAVSNVASLIIKGIGDIIAPSVQITTTQKALIDNGHLNNYVKDGNLVNMENYMTGLGFSVSINGDEITASDLTDVDFLIITAIEINYTIDELNVLSTWLSEGRRSIFVTGRGDFSGSIEHSGLNSILQAFGTVIRMNDDNVYTTPSDPSYNNDWYVYSQVTTPPPGKSYLDTAKIYHSFSPNSLYFTGTSNELTILVNGSKYDYQTDQNPPSPTKIWDDSNDDVGGEVIPLVAAEQLSNDNDRIIVFGATDFSDFSFGPSGSHDDEEFLATFIEWVLFDSVGEGITFKENTSTEQPTTSPWMIVYSFPVILVAVYIHKKRM
jgi:hypothetical protein